MALPCTDRSLSRLGRRVARPAERALVPGCTSTRTAELNAHRIACWGIGRPWTLERRRDVRDVSANRQAPTETVAMASAALGGIEVDLDAMRLAKGSGYELRGLLGIKKRMRELGTCFPVN